MPVELLRKSHERGTFDCGEISLNDYIAKFARQNDEKGLGKTFVYVEPPSQQVLAYYMISVSSIQFDIVPTPLPRYPVPVVHLGRLAVDRLRQNQKLGAFLLVDALRRAERVSADIGLHAIEVLALHERARNFYLKFGFTPLKDDPLHLYLPMKQVRLLRLN